jgi:Ca2+-binding RTX toxin-like protein
MKLTSYQYGPNPGDVKPFDNDWVPIPFLADFDEYTFGDGFIRFHNSVDGSFMRIAGDFVVSDQAEAGTRKYETDAGTFWLSTGTISRIVYSTTMVGGEMTDVDFSVRQLMTAANTQEAGPLDDVFFSHNDTITLSSGHDLVHADDGIDRITVSSGRSFANGGAGDDIMRVTRATPGTTFEGAQRNYLYGNYGDDFLLGWYEHDKLKGAEGDDVLRGSGGNDSLIGDQGADRLFGGRGDDMMNGGAGADAFWFGKNSGNDLIWHFHTRGPERDTIEGVKILSIEASGSEDSIINFSKEGDMVVLAKVKPSELDYLL